MAPATKVVWKEGMFLQPQHFQQTERHWLNVLHQRVNSLNPYAYGLSALAFDNDALGTGLLALSRCKGVFADGTPFSAPDAALLPKGRSVQEHFSADRNYLDVYLALPVATGGREIGKDTTGAEPQRYVISTEEVRDDNMVESNKPIAVATLVPMILFETESRDTCTALRVARLVRDSTGGLTFDPAVIAPVLRIDAAGELMNGIRQLLQVLMATVTSLSQSRHETSAGLAGFSSGEETSFRLLQTLNTFTPLLAHYHLTGAVHPFDLFCLLNQFAGALCTFSAVTSIASLPRYDHDHCGPSFKELFGIIRSIVSADRGGASRTLPVESLGRASYRCRVSDRALLGIGRFYLAVRAAAPEKELLVGVVQRMKIASPERIELLIASAMPGLRLMHSASMPEDAAVKPGYVYFSLEQQGEIWNGIVASGVLSFHFPHDYADFTMELLALRTGR